MEGNFFGFPDNSITFYGGVWSTNSNPWNEYSQHVKLKFGNGNNILFWSDIWMGNESFKSRFLDLYRCSTNKRGKATKFYSPSGWTLTFKRVLNDR